MNNQSSRNADNSMISLLKSFFGLYGRQGFQRRFIFTTSLAIVAGFLETFGLLLVYPLLQVLLKPDIAVKNPYLSGVSKFLNLNSVGELALVLGIMAISLLILKNLYMVLFTCIQLNFMRDWKISIRNQFMSYYLRCSYMFFLTQDSNKIIQLITDFVLRALDEVLLPLMNLIVNTVIVLFIFIFIGYRYFLYLILTALFLSICGYIIHKLIHNKICILGKQIEQDRINERRILSQSLISVKEMKVTQTEHFFIRAFSNINQRLMQTNNKIQYYQRAFPFMLESLVIIAISIMALGSVITSQESGAQIVTSLGVLVAMGFRLAPMVSRILGFINTMHAGKASLEMIVTEGERQDFFTLQSKNPFLPQSDKLPFNNKLELKQLSFSYPNTKKPALKDINICIARGEFIGIVGASGAGKSTFVDVLLGLMEPQEGQIRIDGVQLTSDNARSWCMNIGYVPQKVYLINSTIRESVAFGQPMEEIDDGLVEEVLKKASLWNFIQSLPDGIYSFVGEDGKNLSVGQCQRIAIARALYRQAKILILDEATSALDNTTEFEITSAISSLRGEYTLLVIAHRLSTLKYCDRVLFFRDGELVDSGSFTELSKHKDFEQMLKISEIH